VPRWEWEIEKAPNPSCHEKRQPIHRRLVDVIGRACFDAPDQIGWRLIWFQSKKNVRVIWHTIDRNKLLIAPAYDSRDVFLKFLLTLGLNDTCTPRNGKDDMQIDCVDAENTSG
jgi:hypothetical protein